MGSALIDRRAIKFPQPSNQNLNICLFSIGYKHTTDRLQVPDQHFEAPILAEK
jgi:hypothetical protein